MGSSTESGVHLAVVASLGVGHMKPLAVFSNRIISLRADIHVTFFFHDTDTNDTDDIVSSSSPPHDAIRLVKLPPIDQSTILTDSVGARITITNIRSLPSLRASLLASRPSVLVVDFFATDAFDVARELDIPKYVYFTSNLWALALMLHSPQLDKDIQGEYVAQSEPIRVPGFRSIRAVDLPDPMPDREGEGYQWYLHTCNRLKEADGILVNTFEGLDDSGSVLLSPAPPVFLVGPLIRSASEMSPNRRDECLTWLDSQPAESVLFVSFGSGGTLSREQTTELAFGLEMSGKRFLWVCRPPTRTGDSAEAYFGGLQSDDPLKYLPEGFMERTRRVGLVVPNWVPQVEILGHTAVGVFLSHCGWNSTLESMIAGKPMIAWPLYSEQCMNAVLLSEGIGMAVHGLKGKEGRVVKREEIAELVNVVFEGKVMRDKAKEMSGRAVVAVGEGGTSYKSLLQVFEQWKIGSLNYDKILR
ncbi:UDP-glycosyltransferase 72B3 [Acorus gramineus]|uniref:Glycosyltransferase n=1 Tax=Acorus gramineus TaxID=55184 RepID=A0AAV9ATV8_ACOGR|nr:UDP-glycosyltransferase 72B3 [Acorus gramineus]